MGVVTIPNRPTGAQSRSIAQILANFDAITAVMNGHLDNTNLDPTLLATLIGDGTVKSGKVNIPTVETRNSTTYALLATPDQVSGIVMPTDGVIQVFYSAQWKEITPNAARAAIFLNANQIKVPYTEGPPTVSPVGLGFQAARTGGTTPDSDRYRPLVSCSIGLVSANFATTSDAESVTTGQVLGIAPTAANGAHAEIEGAAGYDDVAYTNPVGGVVTIEAAAGTYDVSVQFRSTAGLVTVKNRILRVRGLAF